MIVFNDIKEIAEGKDHYKKQRMDILSKMHTHTDGDSYGRIVDLLGIAKWWFLLWDQLKIG